MLLWVRHGKGNKDRAVPLSPDLLTALRDHGQRRQPTTWLFPGASPNGQRSLGGMQKVIPASVVRAAV